MDWARSSMSDRVPEPPACALAFRDACCRKVSTVRVIWPTDTPPPTADRAIDCWLTTFCA